MKFTKYGKTLLMGVISAALLLCVTSCVRSYSVGYLYVFGTDTAQSAGNGIITGFSIDHNTGKLTAVRGLPVSSGGANPVRAVLVSNSRFLYVLNRGVTASGGSDCTTADPCQNSNITLYAVGGDGILTLQETFYSQGINPFRIIADTSQSYIYVLDHDSPDNYNQSSTDGCALALGGVQTCGDITAFSINQSTGRLSLIVNAQVTAASDSALPYFPVPANPVDFIETSGSVLTLTSTNTQTDFPYVGGNQVFPYTFVGSGQLTINQNSPQPITDSSQSGIPNATALNTGGNYFYVLDNNSIYLNGSSTATSASQVLPYTVASNGALQSQTGGPVADDPVQSNPIFLVQESKGKWLYVANQGNPNTPTIPLSGITGYIIDPSTHQLSEMSGLPFTTGAGPQCLVEDPSNQFFYTANFIDSTVSGNSLDQNSGYLVPLAQNHNVPSNYTLAGPANWCLMDGRTD
jgi:6-phosphogluconolactonase (cycloisomerase 2 family)